MKKVLSSGLVLGAMISLVGCGGGSSDSSADIGTSFYIDSAVEGVNYKCGTQEGITEADGKFNFDIGSGCTFHLGDIKLRDVNVEELVDGADLNEKNDALSSVLLGLDTDGDPSNGITINADIVDALVEAGITEIPDTDVADLEVVKTEIVNSGGTYVTLEEAQAHLDETATTALTSLLAGKTFYNVGSDSTGDNWIDSMVFNADATSLEWTSLTITESGTHTIVVEGDKIILSGGDIVGTFELTFVEETADKLVFQGLDANGVVVEEDFMFFNQADAEAYYDSLQPAPTTPDATNPEIEALTNKNDIWIIKNINQAEIDRLKTYAIDQMWFDPTAVTYTGDVSCGDLGGYGLQSATPETLTGGTITSATGIEALTYKLADDTFYCKEYTLPADANNNGASSYGGLTFAIAGWNNAIDQSLHTTYLSGTSTSTPVVDPTPESALETFVSGKEFSLNDGAMYPTFHANYDYYDIDGGGIDSCSGTWSVVSSNMISVANCGVDYEFNGELVDGMTVTLHFTDPTSTEAPMDVTFTELI